MSMYHVKADGAMGVCKAQEGHCPFGGDSGTKHFTSITEAQAYAEKIVKDTTDGGMKKMTKTKDEEPTTIPPTGVTKTNKYDLEVTTWPTERGVHSATYTGWVSDGAGPYDDVFINAGGWIDGEYFDSSDEFGLNRLWDRLPEDVKDELLDGCTPVERNGKIIELEQSGELSEEDEELLDAFWCEGEAWDGSVTIYGRDETVSEMSEWELNAWGLKRVESDDEDEDATEDE